MFRVQVSSATCHVSQTTFQTFVAYLFFYSSTSWYFSKWSFLNSEHVVQNNTTLEHGLHVSFEPQLTWQSRNKKILHIVLQKRARRLSFILLLSLQSTLMLLLLGLGPNAGSTDTLNINHPIANTASYNIHCQYCARKGPTKCHLQYSK